MDRPSVLAQNFNKLFETRRTKALLFLGLLIGVLVINDLLAYIIYGYFDFPFRLFLLSGGVPVGLYVLMGGYVDEGILFLYFFGGLLMWFVFIVIMTVGIGSRNLRTSKVLFIVHMFLLIASLIVSLLNDG